MRLKNKYSYSFVLLHRKNLVFCFIVIITIFSFISCSEKAKKNQITKKITDLEPMSELIDGPANIRDNASGKIIFKLFDSTKIITENNYGEWRLVGVWIRFNNYQKKRGFILPGEKIIDSNNKQIGVSHDTIQVYFDNGSDLIISGFTSSSNIRKSSIIESIIANKINKRQLLMKDFNKLISLYDFEKYDIDTLTGYNQYLYYESILKDPSPIDRISLLFNANNILIGVIHSRPLLTIKWKTINLKMNGQKISLSPSLTTKECDRIVNSRNKFYQGID